MPVRAKVDAMFKTQPRKRNSFHGTAVKRSFPSRIPKTKQSTAATSAVTAASIWSLLPKTQSAKAAASKIAQIRSDCFSLLCACHFVCRSSDVADVSCAGAKNRQSTA